MALDTLLGWSSHISTIMLITGMLHLGLIGIRAAALPADHPIKKWGETGVSTALFPMGVLQIVSLALYVWTLGTGVRDASLWYLPPPYNLSGLIGSALYGGSMAAGGVSAVSQIGRKVPWAVLSGGAVGAIGAGSVWAVANGAQIDLTLALAGSGLIGFILFLSMFFVTLPGEATLKAVGNAAAYSAPTLINGALMSILGVISGMGLVVL